MAFSTKRGRRTSSVDIDTSFYSPVFFRNVITQFEAVGKRRSRERNSSQWRLFNEEKKKERRLKSLACVRVRVEAKSHQRIRFFNDGEEKKRWEREGERNGFETIRLVERQLVTSNSLQGSHMTRSDIEFRRYSFLFFRLLFLPSSLTSSLTTAERTNERPRDVLLCFFSQRGKELLDKVIVSLDVLRSESSRVAQFHRK